MEELVSLPPMYKKSDDLINDLAKRCAVRGFRLYRHSTGNIYRESKLLLMCHLYQSIRCPFIMDFRRPELPKGRFVLLKYRIEHNHPIIPNFKATDRLGSSMRSAARWAPGTVPNRQPGSMMPAYNGYPSLQSQIN